MRKIIIAPDSFKGTLSSVQVCQFIQAAAQEAFPACEVLSVPIADGGEGSVDCMLAAAGGKRCFCTVTGPLFSPVRAILRAFERRRGGRGNGCLRRAAAGSGAEPPAYDDIRRRRAHCGGGA